VTDHAHHAAVIGWPIHQSLSPVIHHHWFEKTGLDGIYHAVAVAPDSLAAEIARFRAEGYAGFNVTVPHKEAIILYLDKLAPLARQMGAVNTVKIEEDGTLTGFNTDGMGLITHLKETVSDWPKDKPALILGAGGAARAAALGLINENVPMVMITNRTRARAETLAQEVGRGRMAVVDWDDRETAVSAAGLIVNTTTLGMIGQPALALNLDSAASDTVVYDIVYKPLLTPLLARAKARGLRVVDGLGMLVHQGAKAFKIWFGEDVGYDEDLKALM